MQSKTVGYSDMREGKASQGMSEILILHPCAKNFNRNAAHSILMNPQIVLLLFTFEPPRMIPEEKVSCRELRDSGIPSPSSLAITPCTWARPKAIFYYFSPLPQLFFRKGCSIWESPILALDHM